VYKRAVCIKLAALFVLLNHIVFDIVRPALDKWVNDYNTDFPYSSIDYQTPCEFEQMELSKIP
jgi:hypothetical protein